MYFGAFGEEFPDDFEGGSKADVIGIGFEGEAEYGDALALHDPERFANFLCIAADALLVHALGGFQNVEIDTDRSGEVDESLHVLGKAEAAETEAGLKKLPADARVEAHGAGHFLDVGSDALAEIGDDIGIADFEGEEGIGGVLDEFGAVDGGDKKLAARSWRARSIVDGTREAPLDDGTIDLAEVFGGGGILDAYDDAVGVEEVLDGGPFAQELGVGGHAKFDLIVATIRGEGAAEFDSGSRRDGALLDDQFRAVGLSRNLARAVIDGGKIGLAIFFWRRADADKDGVAGANRFAAIGGVGDFSGGSSGFKNLTEMQLVDGNAAGVELGDALAIDIRADDLMARFRKAGTRD